MKQKFDQLLAVGYVGFDVPVYENGTLGVPIPTFQRLAGGVRAWVGPVLDSGESFRVLEHLVTNDPRRAYQVMKDTVAILQSREFRLIETKLNSRKNRLC